MPKTPGALAIAARWPSTKDLLGSEESRVEARGIPALAAGRSRENQTEGRKPGEEPTDVKEQKLESE